MSASSPRGPRHAMPGPDDRDREALASAPRELRYKFVELSIVTDQTIEEAVNQWVARGWTLDGIRFAMTGASRRPAMAFISFVRRIGGDDASGP